jgi:tripartite-type tricarboxylate transporter receptor subunit TctC
MMRFARRQFLKYASAVLAAPALARGASAESYPARTVRVIVPYAPGGPTDLIARPVAERLSERLKQQFYIENIPGAGGNAGAGEAAKAPPDGYTMIFVSAAYAINPSLYERVPYNIDKDFEAVTIAANVPTALMINPSVPAHTVKELVELIKASPGKFSFASPGTGTPPHLVGELFKQSLGLDIVHVPFNGGMPAVQSTLAGHTQMGWGGVPPAMPFIKQGTLRALAMASDHRSSALPDVPTMAEAGYPDVVSDAWWAVLVPARTPPEVIGLLNREIVAILAEPKVKENLLKLGYELVASSPEECAAKIKATYGKWAKVIREAKLKAE